MSLGSHLPTPSTNLAPNSWSNDLVLLLYICLRTFPLILGLMNQEGIFITNWSGLSFDSCFILHVSPFLPLGEVMKMDLPKGCPSGLINPETEGVSAS